MNLLTCSLLQWNGTEEIVYSIIIPVRTSFLPLYLAIPPGPLRNVTITGCSVMESTSLQVAWELPEMSFGMLVNCSFNISVMEETVENATLIFVPGASQVRNTGVYRVIQE